MVMRFGLWNSGYEVWVMELGLWSLAFVQLRRRC